MRRFVFFSEEALYAGKLVSTRDFSRTRLIAARIDKQFQRQSSCSSRIMPKADVPVRYGDFKDAGSLPAKLCLL